MKYDITGDNLQIVTIQIAPQELVFAEAGAMVYMSGNMNLEAKARGGLSARQSAARRYHPRLATGEPPAEEVLHQYG